jgi:RNase P subunit RPR2
MDINPGDRQNTCKGLLVPIAIEVNAKKGYVVVHKCSVCGQIKRNVCAQDDSKSRIFEIMKNQN